VRLRKRIYEGNRTKGSGCAAFGVGVVVTASLLLCAGAASIAVFGREACLLGVAGGALEAQCTPSKHLISELSLVTDPCNVNNNHNHNKHNNNTAPRLPLSCYCHR
jgi:hypothetical protein